MRRIMGLILVLLLYICLPTTVNGQNGYTLQMNILSHADSLIQGGKYEEALSFLKSNEVLCQVDQDIKCIHNFLCASILYRSGQYADARQYLLNVISHIGTLDGEQLKLFVDFLGSYKILAEIDSRLGKNKDLIIEELEHAKSIYERANATSNPLYAQIISDLNSLNDSEPAPEFFSDIVNFLFVNDFERAIPLLLKVIDYCKTSRSNDYSDLAMWTKHLAVAYMYTGDYNNAELNFLSALDILESHNLQKEAVYRDCLNGVSELYAHLQNYDKANLFNGRAKYMYEKAVDFGEGYIGCLSDGAMIQYALGYNTVAKMYTDIALNQAKKNLSDTISFRKQVDEYNQSLDKPIDYNEYYISHIISPYVTRLSNASMVYFKLGYHSDAIRTIKESVEVSDEYHLTDPVPYCNLGMQYFFRSKFTQGTEWLLKSYSLCKTPYEKDEVGMNTVLGLYLSCNDKAASLACEVSSSLRKNIRDMFAFLNSNERLIYWGKHEKYFPALNLVIYERGDSRNYGTIYDNLLEYKGLLLRSTNKIRDAILKSDNKSDRETYDTLNSLKIRLQKETDSLSRVNITTEIDRLDKILTRNISAYADFVESSNICWTDVRDAISNNDIAVEFYNIPFTIGLDSICDPNREPRYYAAIIKKNYEHPHIIPLCKESQLNNLEEEDIYETDSMYNLIWAPIIDELNGVSNIYFAADGKLHKIGIEYVPMSNGKNISEQYNIYRLSSTRILTENKNKRKVENAAVLYGGLRYDMGKDSLIAESRAGDYHAESASRAFSSNDLRYGVKYLPGTLKEVQDISKRFDSSPRVITDINGTEESFKSLVGTPIDIIHLATHGFFWSEEDAQKRKYVTFLNTADINMQSEEDKALTRSGLLFSGANIGLRGETLPDDVEDGVLTALELSNLNLGHVDMVVMSACESGLGETSEEGVFGLQRGFKLAGANTLLMSLWKVDDTATRLLMSEFYRNYLSGKSKQESLRLAQQWLREIPKYSSPEYWAAFILLDALN